MPKPSRRSFLATTTGLGVLAFTPELAASAVKARFAPKRVGVIGVGRQGRDMLGELGRLEDVTVAAVCDTDERRLELAVRRSRGEARGFADHRQLLDQMRDLDAVLIATPTHTHRQIASDALEAGMNVYCEAPLAHTVEDCRSIVTKARDSDKLFQTGMQGRCNPIYTLARSFVLSGSITGVDRMTSLRGQFHVKNSWRTPANDAAREKSLNWKLDPDVSLGLAGEAGVHQFDVFHWYLGKYPTSVSGHGDIRLWNDGRTMPDTIHCLFRYEDGLAQQYEATLANSYEDKYELFFGPLGAVKLTWTHGWLFKEADAPTQGWEVYANRQQFHNEEGITLIADATQLASQGKLKEGVGLQQSSLYYALEAFFKAIDEGGKSPCSADEGLRAAVVAIAAHQAIATGTTQTIDHGLFRV